MAENDFTKAAAPPEGSPVNDFVTAVLRERPDLRGQPYQVATHGLHSHTLIFEREVFKTPKYKEDASNFRDEYGQLQKMKGKGLPVPEVTCVGKEAVFYGMTRLKGFDLPDVVAAFTPEEKQQLASDIADFIVNLANAMPLSGSNFAKHADVVKNVLVDPETKRLTAVIDVESLRYVPKSMLAPNVTDEFTGLINQAFNQKKADIEDSKFSRLIHKLKR